MNEKQNAAPSTGLSLGDIYYILFRHKWKIALVTALGLVVAAVVYVAWPKPYMSEAKLFVRYVVETKSPAQVTDADTKMKSPDERGESIINTELEILTSLDLTKEVATNVLANPNLSGIAGKAWGTNREYAGGLIRNGLLAEVGKRSSVIRAVYQSSDRVLAQAALTEVINVYLKKHAEIHRSVGVFDDFLTQQTDVLRTRLLQTEDDLRKAKEKAGVISLVDSKKEYAQQISSINQAILTSKAEMAEQQTLVEQLSALLSGKSPVVTNQSAATTNDVEMPSADTIAEYRQVVAQVDTLTKRYDELLITYTPENILARSAREQVVAAEQKKKQLEGANPGLLAVKVADAKSPTADPYAAERTSLVNAGTRVNALQAKVKVLEEQLAKMLADAKTINDMEGTITDLERKKELEESQYKYYKQNLDQSITDKQLGAGQNANIGKVQEPSLPFRDLTKLYKALAGIILGSIAFAFALAFVIELYFDQTLKRPVDVERRVGLPLYLSIPQFAGHNGKSNGALQGREPRLLTQGDGGQGTGGRGQESGDRKQGAGDRGQGTVDMGPMGHGMQPYCEALRDRLMTYFEIRNLTHKPKLLALTSCGEGCGVSTIAAGLAASLSETGDGNVLLVDMNTENGAAHHFHRGGLALSLDDALETDKRQEALVQENLYVVSGSANSELLPGILPKRFKALVPRLRASDYDYIIFDMPPVSQISLTPRLSRFMDTVLMVVESEKTESEVVKRATALLNENKANVGVILNKSRTYVPPSLQQEL